MVLVDRDPVEAELVRVLELVQVARVQRRPKRGSKFAFGYVSADESYFESNPSGRCGYGIRWKKLNFTG